MNEPKAPFGCCEGQPHVFLPNCYGISKPPPLIVHVLDIMKFVNWTPGGEGISSSIHGPQSYDFFGPPARSAIAPLHNLQGPWRPGGWAWQAHPNQPSRARVAFPQKRGRGTGALGDKIATGGRATGGNCQPLRAHVSVRPKTERTAPTESSRLLASLKRWVRPLR